MSEIAAISASISRLQAVKYFDVASMTVLVLDYFLTVEDEIETIWAAKQGLGTTLFLLSRYTAFVDTPLILYYYLSPGITPHQCHVILALNTASIYVGICAAQGILVLRTYALWSCDKRILYFLLALFTTVATACAAFFVILMISLRSKFRSSTVNRSSTNRVSAVNSPPSHSMGGCYPSSGSIITFGNYVLSVLFEAVILALTLFIGMKRHHRSSSRTPLIATLYRDGILYFICLLLCSVSNIIVVFISHAGSYETIGLFNTFQRVMHSIFSARIILHLRKINHNPDLHESGPDILEFASLDVDTAESDRQYRSQAAPSAAHKYPHRKSVNHA